MRYDRDASVGFLVATTLALVTVHWVGCHFDAELRSV